MSEMKRNCTSYPLHENTAVDIWCLFGGVVQVSSIAASCTLAYRMVWVLAVKQLKLTKLSAPILLYDKARSYFANRVMAKLQELELKTLRHKPYSLNFGPTNYHFLKIWITSCREKNSTHRGCENTLRAADWKKSKRHGGWMDAKLYRS